MKKLLYLLAAILGLAACLEQSSKDCCPYEDSVQLIQNATLKIKYAGKDHSIDADVSYNIWQGPNDNRFHEEETWADGTVESIWQSQHQNVKISKWSGGRTLRLAVTYTFGKTHNHEHDRHNHIDTGGYGEEHLHH